MKKQIMYWVVLAAVLITGCQKEVSFELGGAPAEGTLQSEATGDCLPKTVNGVYEAGKALAANTNTITVSINVTKTGTWAITTDTVNGYFFKGTGRFTTIGANTVTLQSSGTPFADGINNFVVSYLGQVCDIQVDVLPAGAGGPAAFTLVNGGTPANCASAVVNGTYVKDVAVNASNSVDVAVNVSTIGTYTITASGGGLTFAKTAAFTTTGNQTVRLNASGTPTTVGPNPITFAAPFASCNFSVNVVAPVTGTLGGGPGACTPVTPAGTYTQGVSLTASNTIQVQITTASVGAYSVTTNTVAGISFSGTGTTTGATQTITLTGTGTPNASGIQNFTVTYGTSTCTFSITIGAAPTIDWKFTVQGGATYQGQTILLDTEYDVTTAPPFSLLYYAGINAATDEIDFTLIDLAGGIATTGETYISTTNGTVNGCAFYFTDAANTIDLMAQPADPTAVPPTPAIGNMTFIVTSRNAATKTVVGTFSGTAFDDISNTTKTITGGTFTAVYQ